MSVFATVDNASPSMGGNYLNDGHRYLLEVGLCKLAPSRAKPGVTNFIAEFRVHESDDPSYPPGSNASWVVDMSKFNAPGNVKWFVGAAKGIGPNDPRLREINQQVCDFVVSPANPLGPNVTVVPPRQYGAMVEVHCKEEDTKPRPDGSRGKFTKHYWTPTQRPPVLPPDPQISQGRQFGGGQQGYGPPQGQQPQGAFGAFPGAQPAAPPWGQQPPPPAQQPPGAPPWAQQPPAQPATPPWGQPQPQPQQPPWGQQPQGAPPPAQQPPAYPSPQGAPPWGQQPPPPAQPQAPWGQPAQPQQPQAPWGQPPLPPGYPQR